MPNVESENELEKDTTYITKNTKSCRGVTCRARKYHKSVSIIIRDSTSVVRLINNTCRDI